MNAEDSNLKEHLNIEDSNSEGLQRRKFIERNFGEHSIFTTCISIVYPTQKYLHTGLFISLTRSDRLALDRFVV